MRLPLNLFRCSLEKQQTTARLQASPPSRPATAPSSLRRPVASSLSRSPLSSPSEIGNPFTSLQLTASLLASLPETQTILGEAPQDQDASAWQETLDRLRVQYGDDTILKAHRHEAYFPELAFHCIPAAQEDPGAAYQTMPGNQKSQTENQKTPSPLALLPMPQEIDVTVSPSDDRDGRPIQFRPLASRSAPVHRITQWVGPERLTGPWWEGRNKTRDYFDVEDETGARYWIFRVQENNRWFMHGIFS
jgi:protein ImuB